MFQGTFKMCIEWMNTIFCEGELSNCKKKDVVTLSWELVLLFCGDALKKTRWRLKSVSSPQFEFFIYKLLNETKTVKYISNCIWNYKSAHNVQINAIDSFIQSGGERKVMIFSNTSRSCSIWYLRSTLVSNWVGHSVGLALANLPGLHTCLWAVL